MSEARGLACAAPHQNNEPYLCGKFGESLPFSLGKPDGICQNCGAIRWSAERTQKNDRLDYQTYSNCCQKGSVTLPMADFDGPPLPPYLMRLFTGLDEEAKEFKKNITCYNNALSFASLGANIDKSTAGQRGINNFRVSGQLTHNVGSLFPEPVQKPAFAQIFIVGDGGEGEVDIRLSHHKEKALQRDTLFKLQNLINEVNPYTQFFKSASAILDAEPSKTVVLKSLPPGKRETKTYNKPKPTDVAALVEGSDFLDVRPRHVVLHQKGRGLQAITDLSMAYFCLRYPLFLPFGSQQWDGQYISPTAHVNTEQLEWAAWLLFERKNQFNPFIHGRCLSQQLIVDLYLCVKRSRLRWYRFNQKTIKADLYKGLREAFGETTQPTGRQIILPATFQGGPRHMSQLYHDAMALVRVFGNPSLFITMTANPEWPEIQSQLQYGEKPKHRPELVARVFHLRLTKLLHEIKHKRRLGVTVLHLMVVKFQKRGLPHSHILVILEHSSRPNTAEDIDSLVTATLPDPITKPRLYQLVTKSMLHGPCKPGMQCYVEGRCRLQYPKPFVDHSTLSDSSFHTYRRPDDGRTFTKGGSVFHNGHVVPYNKYLMLLMECHINVEIPVGTKPVRYLYKYLTKGHDRTRIQMQVNNDEPIPLAAQASRSSRRNDQEVHDDIRQFETYRYISAPEAAHRLMKLPMWSNGPAVIALPLHLEGEQLVYYQNEADVQQRLAVGPPPTSMLTEFFRACEEDISGLGEVKACSLSYVEMPKYFRWVDGAWQTRVKDLKTIGRVHYANLIDGEKYYLRMLLMHVRGPRSFRHLRTVDGQTFGSFRAACDKLGFLASDRHHNIALTEASHWASPHQMRQLFSLITVYGEVASPDTLWNNHKVHLSQDSQAALEALGARINITEALCKAFALKKVEMLIADMGKTLAQSGFSTELVATIEQVDLSQLSIKSSETSPRESLHIYNRQEPTLNDQQRTLLDYIKTGFSMDVQRICFLDGPGGTGKTYTLNTILHYVNATHGKPISVSSSGVSAILLLHGSTAHSAFNIPLTIDADSTCDLSGRDAKSRAIMSAPLIVWDEISMQHKHCIEAVDCSLRHIRRCNKPFGGINIIFSGDFRQTLPIVRHGSLYDQQAACLKASSLWSHVQQFKLTTNLRLQQRDESDVETNQFAQWLLALGDGALQDADCAIVPLKHIAVEVLPPFSPSPPNLMAWVYDDILGVINAGDWDLMLDYYSKRCLITPFNITVGDVNEAMLAKLPGDPFCSVSVDEPDPDFQDPTSIDILNTINFTGFTEHRLYLKIGQPIMLIRNLSLGEGLCIGTRLVIMSITSHVLQCTILTGTKRGDMVAIPRMKLVHRGTVDQPIPFSRRQFPVASAFCLTINKSQGQSLHKVGVFMSGPAFAHGQLYVALSRCTDFRNLRVCLSAPRVKASTTNIVCRALLRE